MNLFLVFLLAVVAGVVCEGVPDNEVSKISEGSRKKRLLFYDEDGNLVKTYTNPFLRDLLLSPEKLAILGNVLNPLLAFFRPATYGHSTHYMVPVSNDVIHQINTDPSFQNKLFILPSKDGNVEANPLCSGRRNQIPSPLTCNRFLNCWDGWAFEQECPAGLLFSNLGYCDYPHNVNCYDRRVKEVETPRCNKDFEVFRSQLLCSEFFVCVNQQPVKFKCPADLAYNQELGICDYPQRVNCNDFRATASSSSSAAPPALSSSPIPAVSSNQIGSSSEIRTETVPVTKPVEPAVPPLLKTVVTTANFSKESWSSTQVATSRQDAIRQLELGRLAKVNTSY